MMRFAISVAGSVAAGRPASSGSRFTPGGLLDVRTGSYRNDVYILIQDDKVVAVDRSAPAGAKVIDLIETDGASGPVRLPRARAGRSEGLVAHRGAAHVVRAKRSVGCA